MKPKEQLARRMAWLRSLGGPGCPPVREHGPPVLLDEDGDPVVPVCTFQQMNGGRWCNEHKGKVRAG